MSIKQWVKSKVKKVIRRNPAAPAPAPTVVPETPRTLDDVIDHYVRYNKAYYEACGPIFQAGRPVDTDELLAHLMTGAGIEDGQHVLEAGCGVCGPSVWFAQHKNITADALTISEEQIPWARENIGNAHLADRIKVHLGDYHKLDEIFPANAFDCVYFLESICHALDRAKVLASAWKVLKPGGCVYIKDYIRNDFTDEASRKRANEFVRKLSKEYCFELVHGPEMQQTIRQAGFDLELFEPMPFVGGREDFSYQTKFEQLVDFHWRDGLDLWVVVQYEARARKPISAA